VRPGKAQQWRQPVCTAAAPATRPSHPCGVDSDSGAKGWSTGLQQAKLDSGNQSAHVGNTKLMLSFY
jgi:hypothetical protein